MTMFIYVISFAMSIEPSVIFFIWIGLFMQLEMRVQEWREMY